MIEQMRYDECVIGEVVSMDVCEVRGHMVDPHRCRFRDMNGHIS